MKKKNRSCLNFEKEKPKNDFSRQHHRILCYADASNFVSVLSFISSNKNLKYYLHGIAQTFLKLFIILIYITDVSIGQHKFINCGMEIKILNNGCTNNPFFITPQKYYFDFDYCLFLSTLHKRKHVKTVKGITRDEGGGGKSKGSANRGAKSAAGSAAASDSSSESQTFTNTKVNTRIATSSNARSGANAAGKVKTYANAKTNTKVETKQQKPMTFPPTPAPTQTEKSPIDYGTSTGGPPECPCQNSTTIIQVVCPNCTCPCPTPPGQKVTTTEKPCTTHPTPIPPGEQTTTPKKPRKPPTDATTTPSTNVLTTTPHPYYTTCPPCPPCVPPCLPPCPSYALCCPPCQLPLCYQQAQCPYDKKSVLFYLFIYL